MSSARASQRLWQTRRLHRLQRKRMTQDREAAWRTPALLDLQRTPARPLSSLSCDPARREQKPTSSPRHRSGSPQTGCVARGCSTLTLPAQGHAHSSRTFNVPSTVSSRTFNCALSAHVPFIVRGPQGASGSSSVSVVDNNAAVLTTSSLQDALKVRHSLYQQCAKGVGQVLRLCVLPPCARCLT